MLDSVARLFFAILLACSYLLQGAQSLQYNRYNDLERRIVVAPPIILPNHSTVWHVGQKAFLSWNLTNIDPSFLDPESQGIFFLGNAANVTTIPNLVTVKLLATNVTITVPDVPARNDYFVILMGDSGDRSPFFIIDNSTASFTSAMSGGHTPSPLPPPITQSSTINSETTPMISTDLPTPTLSTSINPSSPFFVSSSSASSGSSSSAAPSSLGTGNSTGGDTKLVVDMKTIGLLLAGLFIALA